MGWILPPLPPRRQPPFPCDPVFSTGQDLFAHILPGEDPRGYPPKILALFDAWVAPQAPMPEVRQVRPPSPPAPPRYYDMFDLEKVRDRIAAIERVHATRPRPPPGRIQR